MRVRKSPRELLGLPSKRRKSNWWTSGGAREIPSQLTANDCLVVSYPRSGNTWVRLLVADLLLQSEGMETGTELPIHEDQLIPDLDRGDLVDERPVPVRSSVRIFKSHFAYENISNRSVWILRRPASSLVSYYHFFRRYPELARHAQEGVDRFCLDFVGDWERHTKCYADMLRDLPELVHPVFFEHLLQSPVEVLSGIVRFLGIKVDRPMLETAVDNHRLERQTRLESVAGENGERFFRNGNVDDAKEELSSRVYARIQRRLYPRYRELVRECGLESVIAD